MTPSWYPTGRSAVRLYNVTGDALRVRNRMPYLTYRGDRFGLAALTEHSTAWSCPPCSAPLTQFRAQHLLAGALRLTGQLSTSPNHSLA